MVLRGAQRWRDRRFGTALRENTGEIVRLVSFRGKISNESPVGQALLGCKKGDEVTTTGPTGRDIKLTVIKIEH